MFFSFSHSAPRPPTTTTSTTTSFVESNDANHDRKKAVVFSSTLKVVLIPSRLEYKAAGLNPNLWWTSTEFKEFQKTSNSEILLMAKYENIDVRSARRKLYQPNSGCDDKQFEMIQRACAPSSSSKKDDDYYFDEMDDNDESDIDCGQGQSEGGFGFPSVSSPGIAKKSSQIAPHSPRPHASASILQGNDDDETDEHDLHSIALLYPVSSLDNISGGQVVEEVDMYFGNWEGDDDLSLCVEMPGQSLESLEKLHESIQSVRRPVQHNAAGPSSLSAGIAVVSAVILAFVVLTGT